MSQVSLSRAAYVFFVLAVLAALLKLGGVEISTPEPFGQASAKASRTERPEIQRKQTTRPAAPKTQTKTQKATGDKKTSTSKIDIQVRQKGEASIVPQETENGTLIFYRPSKDKPAETANPPRSNPTDEGVIGDRALQARETGPVCGNVRGAPKGSEVVFPLSETYFDSYSDTWGAARPQGGHEGTDLMTPMKTPEYAITDATVVPVSGANDNGWNSLGGYTLMLRADYSVGPVQEGDLFYYAHMDREASLKIGTRVRTGELIGYAGDTGQGSEITRGLFPPHLHLGWYDTSGARTDLASGAMNPYPLLEWIKSNGGAVSGGSDAKFCTAPQTGNPKPSTGENSWPTPGNPGERPDIDTGTGAAAPSPVVKREKPENSPRPDKPTKDDPDKPKPTPPNVDKKRDAKPDGKPGDKNNRANITRADDFMDWVRDFIDKKRNQDSRPDKNDDIKKDDRPDPPKTDEITCKPSDVTAKEKTRNKNKAATKPEKNCEDPIDAPADGTDDGQTPEDGDTEDGDTEDGVSGDGDLGDGTPVEEPDPADDAPDDTPVPNTPEEPTSEDEETEPPVEETTTEAAPVAGEDESGGTPPAETPVEETSAE